MNGQNIVDRCGVRFRDTSNAIVSQTDWLAYANDALMDVYTAEPYWPFAEARSTSVSVAAGAGAATLPDDAFRVTAVFNITGDLPLEPLDGRSAYRFQFGAMTTDLGTPQFYRMKAAALEVLPYADVATTLAVDYFVAPVAITTSTEPAFPEAYHRMLVSGALAYAYEDDGQPAQAQIHRASFDRLLFNLRQDLLSARGENYPGIIDCGW